MLSNDRIHWLVRAFLRTQRAVAEAETAVIERQLEQEPVYDPEAAIAYECRRRLEEAERIWLKSPWN